MSEREIAEAIREIMRTTGEKDPVKALKKAVKALKGRKTTHSRILATWYGIHDIVREFKEWESEVYQRGLKQGYELARSSEPEEVRKKKLDLELKLLSKLDRVFDKIDVLTDFLATGFAQAQASSVKKQLKEKVKVKPKFKVSIEG